MNPSHYFTCKSIPNKFCAICGRWMQTNQSRKVTDKLKTAYLLIFRRKFPRKGRFVPEFACVTCSSNLYKWQKGKLASLPITKPSQWADPEYEEDCYFCQSQPPSRIKSGSRLATYSTTSSSKNAKKANRIVGRKRKIDTKDEEDEPDQDPPLKKVKVEDREDYVPPGSVKTEKTDTELMTQSEANNLVKSMTKDQAEVVLSKLKRK